MTLVPEVVDVPPVHTYCVPDRLGSPGVKEEEVRGEGEEGEPTSSHLSWETLGELREVLVAAPDHQTHPDGPWAEGEVANGPHTLQKGRPRELRVLRAGLPQPGSRGEEGGGGVVDEVAASGPVAEEAHLDVADILPLRYSLEDAR